MSEKDSSSATISRMSCLTSSALLIWNARALSAAAKMRSSNTSPSSGKISRAANKIAAVAGEMLSIFIV